MSPELRFFRVDPRLVHATLLNAWVPALRAEWIVVADAQVVRDPRRRHIYEIAAMEATEVLFVAESALGEALERPDLARPGIVVFSSLAAVLRAVRAGLALDRLNVGHVPSGPGRTELHPAVHLGTGDLALVTELERAGTEVYVQPRPDDIPAPATLPTEPGAASEAPAPPEPEPEPSKPADPHRCEAELEVVNERGLHLRAAHQLAQLANQIPEQIEVGHQGEMVNAKSLLGLTTLGASHGTRLRVVVVGPNSSGAMDQIRALFASGFSEGVSTP